VNSLHAVAAEGRVVLYHIKKMQEHYESDGCTAL